MKEETIQSIIGAIKMSNPDLDLSKINENTRFSDVPNMDSMSIVNFQIDLSTVIGTKANDALPILEMTIGDYADILESL